MFGEIKLVTPYFQQMTLRSKILKIIDTPLNFDHFGGGVFFLKIRCVKCNFIMNLGRYRGVSFTDTTD